MKHGRATTEHGHATTLQSDQMKTKGQKKDKKRMATCVPGTTEDALAV